LALLHRINWEEVVIHNDKSGRSYAIRANCNADHCDSETEYWNTALALDLRLEVNSHLWRWFQRMKRAVNLCEVPAQGLVTICRNVDALLDRLQASHSSADSCGENANDRA
jgi:hypothetical protein